VQQKHLVLLAVREESKVLAVPEEATEALVQLVLHQRFSMQEVLWVTQ
jgi:hypothetical protein